MPVLDHIMKGVYSLFVLISCGACQDVQSMGGRHCVSCPLFQRIVLASFTSLAPAWDELAAF
jgi:hypothetical protein